MAHRVIGQERMSFAAPSRGASALDGLERLVDWDAIEGLLGTIHASSKGEAA